MFRRKRRLRDYEGPDFLRKVLEPKVYRQFGSEDFYELMFFFLLTHGRSSLGSDRGFVSSAVLKELTSQTGLILNGERVVRSAITDIENGIPKRAVFTVMRGGREVDIPVVADVVGLPRPADFVAELYSTFMRKANTSLRIRTWGITRLKIESGETGIHALLPFIFFDDDTSVVSSVTLDYARLREPEGGDELMGVRELLDVFSSDTAANRAAIFLGLLTLGDRRVTDLLRNYRSLLLPHEVKEICASSSQFVHGPVVEFFVDWLEDFLGNTDDERFSYVAARVQRYATEASQHRVVMELQILFPSKPDRRNSVPVGIWSFHEFGQKILPELTRMARRVAEPGALNSAIAAWEEVVLSGADLGTEIATKALPFEITEVARFLELRGESVPANDRD